MAARIYFVGVLAMAWLVMAGPGPSPTHAAPACPDNPTQASFAIWPITALATGQEAIAMHPCGRRLNCVGGSPGIPATRRCRWL